MQLGPDLVFVVKAERECSAARIDCAAGQSEGHRQHATAETEVRRYPSSIRFMVTHIPQCRQYADTLRQPYFKALTLLLLVCRNMRGPTCYPNGLHCQQRSGQGLHPCSIGTQLQRELE